jgi:hypothetical protein
MQFEHGTSPTLRAWDESYYSGLFKSRTLDLTSTVGISEFILMGPLSVGCWIKGMLCSVGEYEGSS